MSSSVVKHIPKWLANIASSGELQAQQHRQSQSYRVSTKGSCIWTSGMRHSNHWRVPAYRVIPFMMDIEQPSASNTQTGSGALLLD
jgi:hypothetical protein